MSNLRLLPVPALAAAVLALGACESRESIDVRAAERLDIPIPAASRILDRDPVPIGLRIARDRLRTIAERQHELDFLVHACGRDKRFYSAEIFLGDTPIRLQSEEPTAPARDRLLAEADETGKGPDATITILVPRVEVDGGEACGRFEYLVPGLLGRQSTGEPGRDIALPGPTPAQAAARRDLDCSFIPKGAKEVATVKRCASLDIKGGIHLVPEQFARLSFAADGFARVHVGQWHIVNRDGGSAPVATFDNWPEDFSEGYVRSPKGPKMGFVGTDLGRFGFSDGALPFQGGVAAVCDGCVLRSDGEHSSYQGGRWTCLTPRNGALFHLRPLRAGETPETICAPYRTSR